MARAAVPETLIVKAGLAAAASWSRPDLLLPRLTELNGRRKCRGSDRVHSLTIAARWREVAKERQDVTPDQPT